MFCPWIGGDLQVFDVNHDGYDDLICHTSTGIIQISESHIVKRRTGGVSGNQGFRSEQTTAGVRGEQTMADVRGEQTTEGVRGGQTTEGVRGEQTIEGVRGEQTTEGVRGGQTTEGVRGEPTTENFRGEQTTEGVYVESSPAGESFEYDLKSVTVFLHITVDILIPVQQE